MAFFDDLSRTLTDMGKEAAQKTKDVVDVLQLKAQISSEKSRLRELYAVIGKNYYEHHTDEARSEYGPASEQIQSTLDRISDMEEKIRSMENIIICPSCGEMLNKNAAYCCRCGTSVRPSGRERDSETPVPYISNSLEVANDEFSDSDGIFVEEMKSES